MSWLLIFFACILMLFLLPLAPALLEWYRPTDDQPLAVVRAHDGNIRYFALRFRDFLDEHIPGLRQGNLPAATPTCGKIGHGAYQLVNHHASPVLFEEEKIAQSTDQLLLGRGELRLQGRMFYEKEVYAAGSLCSGHQSSFRALLAEGDIALGDECDVVRWMHSNGSISVGRKNRLYGRVSAETQIRLQRDTRFVRMFAPSIYFGEPSRESALPVPPAAALGEMAEPDRLVDRGAGRWLIAGSYEIPPGSQHHGALVTKENLVVGENARIDGALKSTGTLRIKDGTCIEGAVVATGNIQIGRGCRISGPVVSEGKVLIATGSVIGGADRPTTITAPEVRIEEGVLVHGAIWARELGYVVPVQS